MDTTELLLAHNPHDAIIMMLNLENNTNFSVNDFEIGIPTPTGTTPNTEVSIKVRDSSGRFDILPYTTSGPINFRYNRLDVGTFFNGVLGGYEAELPTSTQCLLDEITDRVGQQFVLDDIVLEDISRDNVSVYKLTAKSESLRWIGEMPVVVNGLLSLEWYLQELNISQLSNFTDTYAFQPINAIQPSLNATSVQSKLLNIELNKTTQDGADIQSVFNAVVHHPTQAGFRKAAFVNGYFEDALIGWNTVGNVTFEAGRVVLRQSTSGTVSRLYRNVIANAGDLLEITAMIGLAQQDSRQGFFSLFDHDFNVIRSLYYTHDLNNNPELLNDHGLMHFYFRTPINNPIIGFTYAPTGTTANEIWLQQFSCAIFPLKWLPQLQSYSTETDGSYILSSNAVDHWVSVEHAAVQGRSTYIEFKVREKGSQSLGFLGSAVTLLDGAMVDPATIQNGDTVVVILNNPATATSVSNSLGIYVAATDQWVFDYLKTTTLPYAWKRDLIPNWDAYANDSSSLLPTNNTLNGVDITADMNQEGYLNVTYPETVGEFLKVSSLGIALNESFEFSIRGYRPLNSQFVEITFENAGSALVFQNGQWNTGDPRRLNFSVPFITYTAQGVVTNATSNSIPGFTLEAFDNALGSTVSDGSQFTIEFLSIILDQSRWIVSSTPAFNSIYDAKITTNTADVISHWNRLLPDLRKAAIVNLNPSKTLSVSHSAVLLPYTPYSAIPSRFSLNPQLTLYGVSTTDDATYYRNAFLTLSGEMTIDLTKLPSTLDLDVFHRNPPWVVNAVEPSPKNLYGATVQYNGLLRPLDPLPAIQGLDRVCVLYLDPVYCTNYRGIVRFYYR